MTTIGQMYTFEDFNTILFKGLAEPLLPTIKQLLLDLEGQLEITPDQPVAQSVPHSHSHHRRGGNGGVSNGGSHYGGNKGYRGGKPAPPPKKEEEWEAVRSFKATKIEAKVGIEKIVNDIRITLNKMSTSNYEKQKDAVLALIADVMGSPEEGAAAASLDDIHRISKAVFDIASTNKFYSEIYANLYLELAQRHAVFRDLIADFVSNFSQNAGALTYVDPDVDYDGYCVYTKSCDVRKATTTFIVNCLKRGLVTQDKVLQIVKENFACIDAWMREDGKTKEVEEIVENLFIVIGSAKEELKPANEWTQVLEQVRVLAKTKGKTQVSWSNRAAFKMMDLVELL